MKKEIKEILFYVVLFIAAFAGGLFISNIFVFFAS